MSKVDGIWHEMCSGKVNANFLKVLLKIISTDN